LTFLISSLIILPMKFQVLMLLFCLAAGCSTFERKWKEAGEIPRDGIEGQWIGRWHSDYNQHNDKLRCIVTKKNDAIYETLFHAKYTRWIIPVSFGYGLDMNTTRQGGQFQFVGSADLGSLAGGIYQYTGEGNATMLQFIYRAEMDHGTFYLKRPPRNK
tara:strand:- start:2024 stop:2500 length:477 start_codon:yes stop_codon:yes gene_type:complete